MGVWMKKIRSFKCDDCGPFERLVRDEVKHVDCKCNKAANRVISAARYFSNTTGKSPSC